MQLIQKTQQKKAIKSKKNYGKKITKKAKKRSKRKTKMRQKLFQRQQKIKRLKNAPKKE